VVVLPVQRLADRYDPLPPPARAALAKAPALDPRPPATTRYRRPRDRAHRGLVDLPTDLVNG